MAARNRIIAIGVVAALGVMAWSTLRNPDRAPSAPADATGADMPAAGGAPATTPDAGTSGTTQSSAPAGSAAAPGTRSTTATADPAGHLRGLDQEQITQKFSEMLDHGDCANPVGADGKLQCNVVGTLHQRLQEQRKHPDPEWTPEADRALRMASDEIGRNAGNRVRIVDARCGTDVCQVLAIGMQADHNQRHGWQMASYRFRDAPWWNGLGFADMSGMMTSGADGRTVYYVTQITAKPRR